MERRAVPLDEAAGFEAALDILDQLIGYASDRLDESDAGDVNQWRQRRDVWMSRRRGLNPGDTSAVREVLEADGAFLRTLAESQAE
jgi:hypothetical protein